MIDRKFNRKDLRDKEMPDATLGQKYYLDAIPEEHKEMVRRRIKKYTKDPKLLIDEGKALKIIDSI